jgi:hypothetical protein
VRSQLATSYKVYRQVLSAPELSGRIELLSTSAGLWTLVLVTLKADEKVQDIIANGKKKGVIVGAANGFEAFLQPGQAMIMITIALPEDVLKEGLERFKASLL